jgi:hypothetical protein
MRDTLAFLLLLLPAIQMDHDPESDADLAKQGSPPTLVCPPTRAVAAVRHATPTHVSAPVTSQQAPRPPDQAEPRCVLP